jgi:hypothetical protein
MDPQEIADEILALEAKAKTDGKRLTQLKQDLIAAGAGEYLGTKGGKCLVIQPSPSLQITDEAVDSAKAELEKKDFDKLFEKHSDYALKENAVATAKELLEPAVFNKLFQRVTWFTHVKGFVDIARALLGTKKGPALVATFEKPNKAYVKVTLA